MEIRMVEPNTSNGIHRNGILATIPTETTADTLRRPRYRMATAISGPLVTALDTSWTPHPAEEATP